MSVSQMRHVKSVISVLTVIFFVSYLFVFCKNSKKKLVFSGKFSGDTSVDSVTLFTYRDIVSENRNRNDPFVNSRETSSVDNGKFLIRVTAPETRYFYCSLFGGFSVETGDRHGIFEGLVCENGRDLNVQISENSCRFSGSGAEFLNCQVDLTAEYRQPSAPNLESNELNKKIAAGYALATFDLFLLNERKVRDEFHYKTQILLNYRQKISDEQFVLLLSNLRYGFLSKRWLWFSTRYKEFIRLTGNKLDSSFEKEKNKVLNNFLTYYGDSILPSIENVRFSALNFDSKEYIEYVIKMNEAKVFPLTNSPEMVLRSLYETCDKRLFEKVGTAYFSNYFIYFKDNKKAANQLLDVVDNEFLRNLIGDLLRTSTSGQLAYDFSLKDIYGRIHNLNDYKGKVVFMDFWFTGCGACKIYYKEILAPLEEKHKDVVFASICIDKDSSLFRKSVLSGEYSSTIHPNVLNLTTGSPGALHDIIKYYNVVSYPRPLLIGKEMRIFSNSKLLRDKDSLDSLITAAKK